MINENDLASFCLITYNQEKYIKEAIHGALSQTYYNLEIIISDDASTDNTQNIIKEVLNDYKGPHKIIINFNERNLGLVGHVNKVLYDICKGQYIFLAAGDDISLESRVENTIGFYKENPEVVATGSNLQEIDQFSANNNSKNFQLKNQTIYDLSYYLSSSFKHLYGCTRTFTRELINAYPALDSSCPTEDTPLLLRAFLLNKKVATLQAIMVKYRIHDNNISSQKNIVRMNVNSIFEQYNKDIKFARAKKYISHKEYGLIKRVLKSRKKSRLGKTSLFIKLKIKIFNLLASN